ncbi:MAG TPA: hypothetical protein VFM53_01080 [Anaeromyxobacteraceae bacterium]|nr:hypothetical protein [Anaeromyxobacteraceae bacterium]
MAGWAGWGAGPAGAGSAGGPSRIFLGVLLVLSVVASALLLREGRWMEGGVAAAGAAYFGLRFAGRLGPRRGRHP